MIFFQRFLDNYFFIVSLTIKPEVTVEKSKSTGWPFLSLAGTNLKYSSESFTIEPFMDFAAFISAGTPEAETREAIEGKT